MVVLSWLSCTERQNSERSGQSYEGFITNFFIKTVRSETYLCKTAIGLQIALEQSQFLEWNADNSSQAPLWAVPILNTEGRLENLTWSLLTDAQLKIKGGAPNQDPLLTVC